MLPVQQPGHWRQHQRPAPHHAKAGREVQQLPAGARRASEEVRQANLDHGQKGGHDQEVPGLSVRPQKARPPARGRRLCPRAKQLPANAEPGSGNAEVLRPGDPVGWNRPEPADSPDKRDRRVSALNHVAETEPRQYFCGKARATISAAGARSAKNRGHSAELSHRAEPSPAVNGRVAKANNSAPANALAANPATSPENDSSKGECARDSSEVANIAVSKAAREACVQATSRRFADHFL